MRAHRFEDEDEGEDDNSDSNSPRLTLTSSSSHDSLRLPTDGLESPLTEPDLDEFLALSDDDIAEAEAGLPATARRPLAMTQTESSMTSTASSHTLSVPSLPNAALFTTPRLLPTPQPIRAHPVATAAAFEAAKIASRFRFDLVYVMNLWPETRSLPPKKSKKGPTSMISSSRRSRCCCMTGKVLAAYGLATMQSPFSMSAAVHSKMLRTAGWIEYRSQDAETSEFARGYACAFYQGRFDRPDMPVLRHEIDRGIVFAAYRKERKDGGDVGSTPSELIELGLSAESLVEMLMDQDEAERRLGSLEGTQFVEFMGPMPRRPSPAFF